MKTVVHILIYLSMLAFAVLFFMIVWKTGLKLFNKKDELFSRINKRDYETGNMAGRKRELSKRGIMFRTKNYDLNPSSYFSLRVLIGIGFGILFSLLGSKIWFFPIGLLLGFLGTDIYFKYENKKDNEEMTMDIYNTYANLKTQMSAGIYIREVLEYTYRSVNNPRYKEALGELILNFSDKTVPSTEAIRIFKDRFDSPAINKLASLISSFFQYGLNANHVDSIMTEIQSLLQADTLKTEHNIEMKTGATTFAFFSVIIAMIVYIVFSSFSVSGIF